MIDSSIIFQRTHAGRDEIQRKSHGLTQSERLVLIMIDGVSTYQQVRAKLPVLTDDRFARAMQKLQTKELILEVFMPVEGQTPEELERTVIDRFLEQDPLDPVTIMLRDPEEDLGYIGQPAQRVISVQPAMETAPVPALPQATAAVGASPIKEAALDAVHAQLADDFARELQQRQPPRPVTRERPMAQKHRAEKQDAPPKAKENKMSSSQWPYWMIAVGCAFIAGYLLAHAG